MSLAYAHYARGYLTATGKLARGQAFRLRTGMDEGRWANPGRVAAARIPVETSIGPFSSRVGEQDRLWSSGYIVQNMAERRAAAGLPTDFVLFADAGHDLSGDGITPRTLFESGGGSAERRAGAIHDLATHPTRLRDDAASHPSVIACVMSRRRR